MSSRVVDTSTRFAYDDFTAFPQTKQIEEANVEKVAPSNPPTESVEREPYLPDANLTEAVNLAIALGRPLLLQGDPGVGKTRLAHAVAFALGLPLEACYIKSTSRAQDLLYTYDAVNRLYTAQLPGDAKDAARDPANYIRLGPLGRAIARAQYGRGSVVLIDEIDKADLDFPNDLLYELDRLAFQVAEVPSMRYQADNPKTRPIVIVTHNEEKALPAAFLRRCIYHFIPFPESPEQPETKGRLAKILAVQQLDTPPGPKAIEVLLRLRGLDLAKKPGLSELIDWVGYLAAVETPEKELERLPYLGVLLKQQMDQDRAREAFPMDAQNDEEMAAA